MVPPCAEWWRETENWATTPFGYCSSTASLRIRPHCTNARRIRCQTDLNSFPLGELEETTGMPPYYVDEDYPAGPEINGWTKQQTWLRIVHNWCLRLALRTHSGACQKWMNDPHDKMCMLYYLMAVLTNRVYVVLVYVCYMLQFSLRWKIQVSVAKEHNDSADKHHKYRESMIYFLCIVC